MRQLRLAAATLLIVRDAQSLLTTLRPPMVPYRVDDFSKILHFVDAGEATHDETQDGSQHDTRLTPLGEQQCATLADATRTYAEGLDLIVTSPLTRAVQTATLAFDWQIQSGVPCVALEAVREPLDFACDGRRARSTLAKEFPAVSFELLAEEDEGWARGSADEGLRESEDVESVRQRCEEFLRWVLARPEREIAIVSHGALLYAMMNFGQSQEAAKPAGGLAPHLRAAPPPAFERGSRPAASIATTSAVLGYGTPPMERLMREEWRHAEMRTAVALPPNW